MNAKKPDTPDTLWTHPFLQVCPPQIRNSSGIIATGHTGHSKNHIPVRARKQTMIMGKEKQKTDVSPAWQYCLSVSGVSGINKAIEIIKEKTGHTLKNKCVHSVSGVSGHNRRIK